MRNLVLLDLDNTIFQSKRKSRNPSADELQCAAINLDGEPICFTDFRQRSLLDMLHRSSTVIPVTARTSESLQRVSLVFDSYAVVSHGAVLLQPDRSPCAAWSEQVRQQLELISPNMKEIYEDWCKINRDLALGLHVTLIRDQGLEPYVLVKHPNRDLSKIDTLMQATQENFPFDQFQLSLNDNNLAAIPRCVDKVNAVDFLLETYFNDEPRLIVGAGDSLSDLPFLRICDFALIPQSSQLLQTLVASTTEDGIVTE